MYDSAGDEWTQLASMNTDRESHSCGLVTKSNGNVEAVVAGGTSVETVEIFNFDSQEWR